MVIMVMNSKGHNNIYDLSREIENQGRDYEGEAKKIVNAYRQVEQLKVQKDKPANRQQHPRHKPSSNYVLKVKQTLSQLKNSKNKQAEELSKHTVEPPLKITRSNYDRKLIKAGLDRVCSLIAVVRTRYIQFAVSFIKERANQEENKEILFAKKFRLFKLFRAWRDQVILEKMKKQQQEQKQSQLHKAAELAQQFRNFSIIKKSFHAWEITHKRQIKRKAYEKELRRIEMEQKLQKKSDKGDNKRKVEENHELQSKLRGFLDGLKDKIDNKDRLRTIKQKTEESDPNIQMQEEWAQQERREMQELERFEERQRQEEEHSNDRQVIIQPPQQLIAQKKPMTNEELDLKRKELEGKHKKRKQALEKLNREKEEKRKQEEKERMELEREVEAEQKRIKQQKYRQYLKNKKEEEEWQKREKQLQTMALQFNHKRQIIYYGWLQLKNIKSLKKKNTQTMYQSLLLILYRVKASQFVSNLQIISSSILQMQLDRMKERYERKLLTKGLTCFWENRKEQLEARADLTIRHEVNQLKIVFSEWKRATPQMAVENFDWERPRAKRSQEFHRMQLLLKTLSALKENKRSEQESRSLAAQKAKLKSKIKAMLGEEQQQFNYEQYCLE